MRLVTWNLQHGVPTPVGPPDLARGLPALASLEADVIALQELDRHRSRTGRTDQPSMVADALGAVPVFAPALVRGGEYGVGLFVRGRVVASEVEPLAGPGEPRVLLVAEVDVGDGRWTVATTHLATEHRIARAQLAQVGALLEARPPPLVLAGDLNLGRRSVIDVLHGLRVVAGAPTHSARRAAPARRIDHVAHRGVGGVAERVVRMPISDHLAVVVDLERERAPRRGPDAQV